MEKLKELWKKLNPKVALVGGVVVISTSLGTCHLMDSEDKAEAPAAEEAPAEAEATSPEIDRPDYQKRRQEKRISRRKGKAGEDPVYDARTALKEARMKYGRNSKEFKEAKQALQDAKANK